MTSSQRFDRKVDDSIQSQLARILYKVPRREQRRVRASLWLVLEGDFGGQIYLTIPWQCLGHGARVGELLRAIDQLCWGCNRLDGASARLLRPRTEKAIIDELERDCRRFGGTTPTEVAVAYGFEDVAAFARSNRMFVEGGMGGGRLLENRLWLHDELLGLERDPKPVLQPLIDALRGATREEIRQMDWRGRAKRLLGLEPA